MYGDFIPENHIERGALLFFFVFHLYELDIFSSLVCLHNGSNESIDRLTTYLQNEL